MTTPVIECVMNVSEGRRLLVLNRIADSLQSVTGCFLLDWSADIDHNRSVFTFAGLPDAVEEASFRAVSEAVPAIDLRRHQGLHPRIGAVDVVPFVALRNISVMSCVQLARKHASRISDQLGVPTYLYGEAAARDDRRDLAVIRRGGFEKLRDEVRCNPERAPDFGSRELHSTAGATVVGVRPLLIAFNIFLDTSDPEPARLIARRIRESSGGLPGVKALGWVLPARNQAQVSMNLTQYRITGMRKVFDTVRRLADETGAKVSTSELIGLVPADALEPGDAEHMRIEAFSNHRILDHRIDSLFPD